MHKSKLVRLVSYLSVLLLLPSLTVQGAENKLLSQPSDLSDRAQSSVMLDVVNTGNSMVAVGERGFILTSDDNGQKWTQSQAPVSVTLTAVSFADADNGWAVGHGAAVLHTQDGGKSWKKVFDGVQAAQVELEAAKAAFDESKRSSKYRLREAEFSAKQGADKPFLNVHFSDNQNGMVVGAYGLAFTTNDGGETWQSIMGIIPNAFGMHLYDIHVKGNTTFLIGEQGSLFRSVDANPYEQIYPPYEGSFFGMVSSGNNVLLYGLRGHLFLTQDDGETWQQIDMPQPVTITSGTTLEDGRFVLADESGQVFINSAGNMTFKPLQIPNPSAFTSVTTNADGELVLSGARGITRVAVSTLNEVTGNE